MNLKKKRSKNIKKRGMVMRIFSIAMMFLFSLQVPFQALAYSQENFNYNLTDESRGNGVVFMNFMSFLYTALIGNYPDFLRAEEQSFRDVQKMNAGIKSEIVTYINSNGQKVFAGYRYGKDSVSEFAVARQKMLYRGRRERSSVKRSGTKEGEFLKNYERVRSILNAGIDVKEKSAPSRLGSIRSFSSRATREDLSKSIVNRKIYQEKNEEENVKFERHQDPNEFIGIKQSRLERKEFLDSDLRIIVNGKRIELTEEEKTDLLLEQSIEPTITVKISSTAKDVVYSNFKITILFSERIIGFNEKDISILNGQVKNIRTFNGKMYIVDIYPIDAGVVSVYIPKKAVKNAKGFNSESNILVVEYEEKIISIFWNMLTNLFVSIFNKTP